MNELVEVVHNFRFVGADTVVVHGMFLFGTHQEFLNVVLIGSEVTDIEFVWNSGHVFLPFVT